MQILGNEIAIGETRKTKRESLINKIFNILNVDNEKDGISISILIDHLRSGKGEIFSICQKSYY